MMNPSTSNDFGSDLAPRAVDNLAETNPSQPDAAVTDAQRDLTGSEVSRINENMTYLRELGSGAFGLVVEARRPQGSIIAVKGFFKQGASVNKLTKFRREMGISMNLKHGNVVAAFGTGEEGNLAYILMEKHDGDVRGLLANLKGDQLEEVAREVFGQMLDGVAYLHSNGIAHRDIKSKNCLYSRASDGRIRACWADLGLAVRIEDKSKLWPVGGTKGYTSPEIVEENESSYDPFSSDIWALSVVLYTMISYSKSVPWRNAKRNDIAFFAYTQEQNSIFAKMPNITLEAKEVIWAGLKLAPRERDNISALQARFAKVRQFFLPSPPPLPHSSVSHPVDDLGSEGRKQKKRRVGEAEE